MPKEPYRGRFQVQGADIPGGGGGYSHKWAQKRPVTETEGLEYLTGIQDQCNKKQLTQRKSAFKKARRFVTNAAKQGGVLPVGAVNPSNSSVLVEIAGTMAEFSNAPCLLCMLYSDSTGVCDDPDCTPDISCPDDDDPFCLCDAGLWPTCDSIKMCSCPVVTLGQ